MGMSHPWHPQLSSWGEASDSITLTICYLFSGPTRRSSVLSELELLCAGSAIILQWEEFDLLSITPADISDEKTWLRLLRRAKAGAYHVILASPPCEQHSRALFSGRPGPPPLRNRKHPRGLPHLRFQKQRTQVDAINLLYDRTFELIDAARESPAKTLWLLEFPEDLGSHVKGTPATLWDERAHKLKLDSGATSVAFFSCIWGVPHAKPERTMSTFTQHCDSAPDSWPKLEKPHLKYTGPLPRHCGHAHPQLIGKDKCGSGRKQ